MNEIWPLRVENAQEALRRSRYAFIAATVLAVAMIVAEFNSHFSWYRQFALNLDNDTFQGVGHPNPKIATKPDVPTEPFLTARALRQPTDASVTTELQKAMLHDWVESKRVAIGLLGVNIGMSDAAILGSLSLWILATWFYYAVRRENHLIGRLLIDASHEDDPETHRLVFFGISDYTVFITVTSTDAPISALDHQKQPLQSGFRSRFVITTLFFLPGIAIGFIVISDICSLLLEAPMRWPHYSMWDHLLKDGWAIAWLLFIEGFALVFGVCTVFLCGKVFAFEKATGEIMLEFYNKYIWPNEPPT
jgi:hypothetical protein